jgi:hypothetical protein
VVDATKEKGGITISQGGRTVTQGYAVSPYKDTETKIKAEEFSQQHVQDFTEKNSALLDQPGHKIGTWYNEKDGNVYLDVSVVKNDIVNSATIAKGASQIAIYDIEKGEEIPASKYDEIISSGGKGYKKY